MVCYLRQRLIAVEIRRICRVVIVIGVVEVTLIEYDILKVSGARCVVIILNGNICFLFRINYAYILGIGKGQRHNFSLWAEAVFFIHINVIAFKIAYIAVKLISKGWIKCAYNLSCSPNSCFGFPVMVGFKEIRVPVTVLLSQRSSQIQAVNTALFKPFNKVVGSYVCSVRDSLRKHTVALFFFCRILKINKVNFFFFHYIAEPLNALCLLRRIGESAAFKCQISVFHNNNGIASADDFHSDSLSEKGVCLNIFHSSGQKLRSIIIYVFL